MTNVMQTYMDSFEASLNKIDSFEQLTEALKTTKVSVSQISPQNIEGLKDDVFGIKNESPIIDALVKLLGIPDGGVSIKIRAGFMAYDDENKMLFFARNKYDLPAYLGKRPAK